MIDVVYKQMYVLQPVRVEKNQHVYIQLILSKWH